MTEVPKTKFDRHMGVAKERAALCQRTRAGLPPLPEKLCYSCWIRKPRDEFHKSTQSKQGIASNCKECTRKKRKEYTESLPRDIRSARGRAAMLKNKYGLTARQVEDMIERQGRSCAICKKPRRLVVDHCHVTGRVRGMLCGACNTFLGLADDDTTNLMRAVGYLRRHGSSATARAG